MKKKKAFKAAEVWSCGCSLILLNFPITYPFSLNRTEKKESNRRRGRFKDRKGKCDWSKGRCVWPGSPLCPPPSSPTLLQPIDPAVLPKSGWWRTLSASALQWEKGRVGEGGGSIVQPVLDKSGSRTVTYQRWGFGPSLIISDFYFISEHITSSGAPRTNVVGVKS